MSEVDAQDRALAQRALEVATAIGRFEPANCHVLIACSKTKGTHRDEARHLYASPLYRKSVQAAEGWHTPFSILSAKFGLLHPDDVIEPYDLTLKGASSNFKIDWAQRVKLQFQKNIAPGKKLIFLAGDHYLQPLLGAEGTGSLNYYAPMKGLSLGNRLAFLNQCIRLEIRRRDLARAYKTFEEMRQHAGMHQLKDILETELPKQGVYFFFDDNETSAFSSVVPRLVRIGTHGVSAGSTATLRTRLRTHFGTKTGAGNHRASVFRLHVGRAIIEREKLNHLYMNWGKGQSTTRDITASEAPLELRVSDYIGKLRVLYLPVSDASGTESLRALIEREFIALFTEHMCPLETASPSWLGHYSDKPTIRGTGLWNIRDVGGVFDQKFARLFQGIYNTSVRFRSEG